MHSPFVQDEMPEHKQFAFDKLHTRSQFFQDDALENGLFAFDKLQMRSQFVQNEALEHGLFEDEVHMPRQFFQDKAPGHRLLALPNFRCIAKSSLTKHLSMGYLKIKFK